jgi:hypothetical protein
MRHRSRRSLSAAALACLCAGCGTLLRNAAEEVTPAVIAGAVEGLADPDTQRRLVAAIDEDRVQVVSARLSAGMVDGVLDTLEDPARRERLETIVNGLVANASGTAVDTMLERALDERAQARMRKAMRATVTALVTATFEAVDSQTMSPEARTEALGVAAREIMKQATLGFQDALDDTRRDRASGEMPQADGSLLIAANNASATGSRIVWILGIGLAAVALVTVLALIWAVRKNRLRRSEVQQRDGALLLLTDAIQATAEDPGAEKLRALLKAAIGQRGGGEHIRKALGERGRRLLGILDEAGSTSST